MNNMNNNPGYRKFVTQTNVKDGLTHQGVVTTTIINPANKKRITFNLDSKYVIGESIGSGAYGEVCSAVVRGTQQKVAIKKMAPFAHTLNALRTLREMKLLRWFHHENIISILDIIVDYTSLTDLYLVQEFMETDMYRVIKSQDLTDEHCQYFIYQILRALKAIHSANVLHRDLKPSNLLVNADCSLKICDFGLARPTIPIDDDDTSTLTEYVATRWYRAPEVMLSLKLYSKAIDTWSVGCILGEMLSRKPMFPGENYTQQLSLILKGTGYPSEDDIRNIASPRGQEYIKTMPRYVKPGWVRALRLTRVNPAAIDLLDKLLAFDPNKRVTVEDALKHEYLEPYHDPDDEPDCPPVPLEFFSFDREKNALDKKLLKNLIFQESLYQTNHERMRQQSEMQP